ncbi:Soluble guanylate cyclase 88E [Tetrabaena socialis]|uniref:Soluble guanylate cyclase 88E n=1 Tax=Tetrabaena socialis TaxID=47790 RepID=A0A2J8AA39_9CHLO|nr:Soluble guanylate cyclase 88E [Tetrabaena socialis]|eukprot:PNH09387.1 Soluble guanylate cyclase 88E [Tetrabaena socialis]
MLGDVAAQPGDSALPTHTIEHHALHSDIAIEVEDTLFAGPELVGMRDSSSRAMPGNRSAEAPLRQVQRGVSCSKALPAVGTIQGQSPRPLLPRAERRSAEVPMIEWLAGAVRRRRRSTVTPSDVPRPHSPHTAGRVAGASAGATVAEQLVAAASSAAPLPLEARAVHLEERKRQPQLQSQPQCRPSRPPLRSASERYLLSRHMDQQRPALQPAPQPSFRSFTCQRPQPGSQGIHRQSSRAVAGAGEHRSSRLQGMTSPRVLQFAYSLLPPAAAVTARDESRSGARQSDRSARRKCSGLYGGGGGDGQQLWAWHEVRASVALDPLTGERLLVVVQKDVSRKVAAERHIAQVSEAEHRLLEQVFPRHVLSYLTRQSCDLQRQHSLHELQSRPYVVSPMAIKCAEEGPPGPSIAPWRPHVRDCTHLATWHGKVTVLFADIQGFTPLCGELPAAVVMKLVHDLFVRFDEQLDEFGVYKVETIGDCYVVAGGLVHEDADGMAAVRGGGDEDPQQAERVFAFAQAMLRSASTLTLPTTGLPVRIRVGIHSGPLVSGVVGTRMPRFCLFGDTINTASRMESTGIAGCVHVSEATYGLLRLEGETGWEPTGGIDVKGKGILNTFTWTPPPPLPPPSPCGQRAGLAEAVAGGR